VRDLLFLLCGPLPGGQAGGVGAAFRDTPRSRFGAFERTRHSSDGQVGDGFLSKADPGGGQFRAQLAGQLADAGAGGVRRAGDGLRLLRTELHLARGPGDQISPGVQQAPTVKGGGAERDHAVAGR
jgi:hypothetical protein